MSRSLSLAALGLALAAAGCTSPKSKTPNARLRQPQAVATFQGVTLDDPAIRPYLAIANSARNDVTLLHAEDDSLVYAPIELRSVLLPVANRPSLLASASLGDDEKVVTPPATTPRRHADLLVAVSAGDSVLQVIETWTDSNEVHSDPTKAGALAVDLGHDVLALASLPPDPVTKTARIAALLAGDATDPTSRVAIVSYKRDTDGEAIVRDGDPVPGPPLGIFAEDLAALPDADGVGATLYVGTLDPVATDGAGNPLYGVVELAPDRSFGRGLVARAPTRLVAAARLRERFDGSASSGPDAFPADPLEAMPRVYAVLDESACGVDHPIDCGVVTIDPGAADPLQAVPPDYAGLMPYRAPMRVPGRPLQLAIAAPPEVPLGDLTNEAATETSYPDGFMRLYMGTIGRATTGVAAVASDDGNVYFLDLGRFETETQAPIVKERSTGSPVENLFVTPPVAAGTPDSNDDVRLWLQQPDGTFASSADATQLYAAVDTTPGFTPDQSYEVRWQGVLGQALQLFRRSGEVAPDAGTGQLALALQLVDRTDPLAPIFSSVVRLWHPALGVAKDDILVIKAAEVPGGGCTGTLPPANPYANALVASDPENEFELRVGDLLPPSNEHRGGAVSLVRPPDSAPEWQACYDALAASATAANPVSHLRVTIRASGLVLTGTTSLGYLGRPQLGTPAGPGGSPAAAVHPHVLQYPATAPAAPWEEERLAALCPVADWDGVYPPSNPAVLTCDATCRAACEQLVLARKARRIANVSVDCTTSTVDEAACLAKWPAADYPFPVVNGPMLGVRIAVQRRDEVTEAYDPAKPHPLVRDMRLALSTKSGATPSYAHDSGTAAYQATGATPFDRSRWTGAEGGYRFYVSYPADFVLGIAPSAPGGVVPSNVIR